MVVQVILRWKTTPSVKIFFEQNLSLCKKNELFMPYSWVARDVTENQTKKLSILLGSTFMRYYST